ncbi:MAG: aldo/keto reductase [Eubacteriales bacterium]|nr:aldo/keto reductase [Eubacteriales bacterium]
MEYKDFLGNKVSALGFGTMRFPMNDGQIDEEKTKEMIDYAFENGVNYFDTAWPYHDGKSEGVLAKCLEGRSRDSYFLADKFPGHQNIHPLDCDAIFKEQLRRCNTEYFDYYLLHNINDSNINVYTGKDPDIGAYLMEQKKAGYIKHLGLSAHATADVLEQYLDYCDREGIEIEFCQIQLNYLDWSLQEGERKLEILKKRNLPIIVMEPLRGGKLANVEGLERSASYSFRWLMNIPEIKVILSGMSAFDQVKDNINTFNEYKPLNEEENAMVLKLAEGMKKGVPCTGCRYCVDACPIGLDIPFLMKVYNDLSYDGKAFTPSMLLDSLDRDKTPDNCIGCGACAALCPQHIDIPATMAKTAELKAQAPNWGKICDERNKANKL